MDYAGIDALIQQCATGVAPSTMAAIIRVESAGNPWAIGDNTTRMRISPAPKNAKEATVAAMGLIARGHNLDLGLSQINSSNLKAYKVSVEDMFNPCININVGSRIMATFYIKSASKYGEGEVSLFHALSAYNTGSFFRGPGYVQKILSAAGSKASISNIAWKQGQTTTIRKKYTPKQSTRFNSPIIAINYDEPPFPAGSPNQILAINGE